MFQLLRLTSIRWIIILCLFTQPMQAGDTLLLFKEQSDQKDSTQHLTQDTSHQEVSMVSGSQWVPDFIKETPSYVSLKTSALRNLWGESNDNEKLILGLRKQAWQDAKDLEENMEVIASSNDYSTTKRKQLRLKKLQDHIQQGEIPLYAHEQGLLNKCFNSPLPSNVQSSLCANENKDTKENSSSFISILNGLKGLAHALYKGTRHAVSHPKQLLTLGLAAHILPIAAQTGNDFLINQNTTNTQQNPLVSGLTNGNVFVIWTDFRADTSNSDIFGRVFFPNGSALGSEFIINQNTTNKQQAASIASLINGNVFVVWQDYRASASNSDIYGRVFFPNGTALGSDFIINQITTYDQYSPSVTGLINGNVFVAWADRRTIPTIPDIYGRMFFPNGTALNNDFILHQNTTNSQGSPSVVGLINGNVFVTWDDDHTTIYYPDIYGRVFFPNGTAIGNEFIINQNTTNSQVTPSVAELSNGNVFVVWHDDRERAGITDIFGRGFFSNGTALGNEFIINQNTTNDQEVPSVACLINGNIFIVWQDYRASTSNSDVYGRIFFPNGTALGSDFIINQITINNQYIPSVGGLVNGNVFVTWTDYRSSTIESNIYGRVFSELDIAIVNSLPLSSLSSLTSNPPATTTPTNGGTGNLTTQTSQIASTNSDSSSGMNSAVSTTLSSSFTSFSPSSSGTETTEASSGFSTDISTLSNSLISSAPSSSACHYPLFLLLFSYAEKAD